MEQHTGSDVPAHEMEISIIAVTHLWLCFHEDGSPFRRKENHMSKFPNFIATQLHCTPMLIPVEYKEKAASLAAKYVKDFSLSGLYAMDYNIVYNRVCNLTHSQLEENPQFCVETFSHFLNVNTLFYSATDIQTLVLSYKSNPEAAFPYVICFFARKLVSFTHRKIAYLKGLDREDVDQALMLAVYKTLERYNPQNPFSFKYLETELFAAVAQLNADTRTFTMPRNDFINYQKFSYFIHKYALIPENIEQFLCEINLPENALGNATLHFHIKAKDREYGCKITLRKALDYYSLYSIENLGIASVRYYDDKTDMVIDNSGAIIDRGFEEAELRLYAEQTLLTKKEQRIFRHLTEQGATFSNKELIDDYGFTRYALSKMKERMKPDFR